MDVTRFDDTHVEGTVDLAEGQMLYTSINYDEGWQVTVDGKPMNYSSDEVDRIGNALIGIHLTPGKHTVAFRYHAKGLRTGLLLTLAGVLILVAVTWLPSFLRKRRLSEDTPDDTKPEKENAK